MTIYMNLRVSESRYCAYTHNKIFLSYKTAELLIELLLSYVSILKT